MKGCFFNRVCPCECPKCGRLFMSQIDTRKHPRFYPEGSCQGARYSVPCSGEAEMLCGLIAGAYPDVDQVVDGQDMVGGCE